MARGQKRSNREPKMPKQVKKPGAKSVEGRPEITPTKRRLEKWSRTRQYQDIKNPIWEISATRFDIMYRFVREKPEDMRYAD